MRAAGALNRGASGNASVRHGDGMRITPSARSLGSLTEDDLVFVRDQPVQGASSEWPMHAAIYAARPDVHAVLHVHSPAATAFSCLREDLPPFHYMVAIAGGDHVACAPYALFGSQDLADACVVALGDRHAVLLANHGLITCGPDMARALEIAEEIEGLCDAYLRVRGETVMLTSAEMQAVLERFRSYR